MIKRREERRVERQEEHDREEWERLVRDGDWPPPRDDVDGDEMGEPDDDVREAFGDRESE